MLFLIMYRINRQVCKKQLLTAVFPAIAFINDSINSKKNGGEGWGQLENYLVKKRQVGVMKNFPLKRCRIGCNPGCLREAL